MFYLFLYVNFFLLFAILIYSYSIHVFLIYIDEKQEALPTKLKELPEPAIWRVGGIRKMITSLNMDEMTLRIFLSCLLIPGE